MPLAAATLHVDECSLTHYTFGLGPGGWLWRWGGPRTWAPSTRHPPRARRGLSRQARGNAVGPPGGGRPGRSRRAGRPTAQAWASPDRGDGQPQGDACIPAEPVAPATLGPPWPSASTPATRASEGWRPGRWHGSRVGRWGQAGRRGRCAEREKPRARPTPGHGPQRAQVSVSLRRRAAAGPGWGARGQEVVPKSSLMTERGGRKVATSPRAWAPELGAERALRQAGGTCSSTIRSGLTPSV